MITIVIASFALPLLSQPSPEAAVRPWWHEAVFYELFVRSFADSIDGPLARDGVGDFRGLIDRLDDLNDGDPSTTTDLGIDAVWLMPICQSPTYHGYDIVDYTSVDDEYGTNDDFRAFVVAAHERGVRVVVDLVLNHCSDRHPWFVEASGSPDSAKHDWFVWSDADPGYRGPWGQQVWHPTQRGGDGPYYYGCFSRNMPDLNVTNAEVTAALRGVARFWIRDMGVDGFRLDAIKHLVEDGETQENTQATIDWLEGFNAYCKSLNPEFFTVGEVWSSTDQVSRYLRGAVDTAFEFDLARAVIDGLNTGDAHKIRDRVEAVISAYDTPVATFLTNHDQARVMSQLGGSEAKARAAAAILLTLPGVPFVYYGEEIGQTGDKPDPNIRTPMQWDRDGRGFSIAEPWRAAQPDAGTVNVAMQRGRPRSLLTRYTDLIALRHRHAALRTGETVVLDPSEESVLAYIRRGGGEQILVIVNTGDEAVGWAAIPLDRAVPEGPVRAIGGNRRPFGSLSDDRATFRSGGLRPHEVFIIEMPGAE